MNPKNVENVNFEKRIVKVGWEWTRDEDLFMKALDQWISEILEDDYWIYE